MKKWFCATISKNTTDEGKYAVLEECEAIERDGYKVEQITYSDSLRSFSIFYTREATEDDAE